MKYVLCFGEAADREFRSLFYNINKVENNLHSFNLYTIKFCKILKLF